MPPDDCVALAGESTKTVPINNNQARHFMVLLQEGSAKLLRGQCGRGTEINYVRETRRLSGIAAVAAGHLDPTMSLDT
jgi:hypothetical protein